MRRREAGRVTLWGARELERDTRCLARAVLCPYRVLTEEGVLSATLLGDGIRHGLAVDASLLFLHLVCAFCQPEDTPAHSWQVSLLFLGLSLKLELGLPMVIITNGHLSIVLPVVKVQNYHHNHSQSGQTGCVPVDPARPAHHRIHRHGWAPQPGIDARVPPGGRPPHKR